MVLRSFVSASAIAIATVLSCTDATTAVPCTNVPAGGCPLNRGQSCADPDCEAVYYCRENNVWELKEKCPPREPRPVIDASAPETSTTSFDAALDAPPGANGGPGCALLQEPDCPLGLVLACGSCCNCEDLYVCENESWSLYGTCSADGGVTQVPRTP